MDKYKRYRLKCTREGRCPHCGKPCAPYYECDERRQRKQFGYRLRRTVKAGIIGREKVGRECRYYLLDRNKHMVNYQQDELDRRYLPRIGKKFLDIETLAETVLRRAGRPMGTEEISVGIMEEVTRIKQSFRP